MKRFDVSLQWLLERITIREDEIAAKRRNGEIEEQEMNQMLRTKRTKSIEDVLAEVEVLIDTHFFNEFMRTKSSSFLKIVIENQRTIDVGLFKKTWRSLNCSAKTMNIIRETHENLLCVGKRRELITKKKAETQCRRSKSG